LLASLFSPCRGFAAPRLLLGSGRKAGGLAMRPDQPNSVAGGRQRTRPRLRQGHLYDLLAPATDQGATVGTVEQKAVDGAEDEVLVIPAAVTARERYRPRPDEDFDRVTLAVADAIAAPNTDEGLAVRGRHLDPVAGYACDTALPAIAVA